jgi:3',5'-cyclic AMP phosphodiesterase CpdA
MSRNLVIAVLSDMHLSRFGERVTAGALLRGRLPRSGLLARGEWRDFEDIDGWTIQRWNGLKLRGGPSFGFRLLDPEGVRHDRVVITPGRNHARRVEDALRRLKDLQRVRSRAALEGLCKVYLPVEERHELLRLDPHNTNLRFLESLDAVHDIDPDVVVLAGDHTDDGHGYELVLCKLREYIESGRLFAVAGNHDLSAVPPGTNINMPLHDKASRWSAFRCAAGLGPEREGASELVIDDVLFLGLNSSVRPSRVAWSGRGRVGKKQLNVAAHLIGRARETRAKICCVHHHVAHLRLGPIARADPGQFAMKLRDARDVMSLLGANDFSAVLNGHRHHGYHVHEANLPHVVSSPSTTLGCRASGERYLWRIEVGEGRLRVDRHYFGRS